MASAYGSWVGGDDWRAYVEITLESQTDTTGTFRVKAWMYVDQGSSSNSTNIKGWAGIWDAVTNDYRWSSAVNLGSFSSGAGWITSSSTPFKSQAWTVTKTHSSQTVYGYSDIIASAGVYSGSESKAEATITLGAKTSYAVKYNANGGSGAPSAQTKWHDEALTLSSTKPTRTGYSFKGWATSSSSTTVAYAAGASYTNNSAVTLYAVWKANTYTVSYNANGGSGAPSAQTKTYGVALTLSSTKPTRTGYTFKGWATSSSSTTVAYAAGGSYTANSAATLYAVWQINTYSVSYNANGGSGTTAAQTKTYGVTLPLRLNGFTRTNYVFNRWNTKADNTGTGYSAGGNYTANAAVTLYAIWYEPHYITYNANGGSGAPAKQTKVHGQDVTISTTNPTRTGYSFVSWNTKADGTGTTYSGGYTYSSDASDLTLYAIWRVDAPTLTISSYARCDLSGTVSDEGTYAKVVASWTTPTAQDVTVSATVNSATESQSFTGVTSGTATLVIDAGLDADTAYTVSVTATNTSVSPSASTTKTVTISSTYYPIDVLNRSVGKGIAFGGAASEEGLHSYLPATFHDALRFLGALVANVSTLGNVKIGTDVPSTSVSGASELAYDTTGYLMWYSQLVRTAADRLYRSFVMQRKDANGDVVQNGFYLNIGTDSIASVTFAGDGKKAWLDGLGIGEVKTNSDTVSVASGTGTAIASVSLTPGVWVIEGNVGFAENATGSRTITLSTSSGSVTNSVMQQTGVRVSAMGGGLTCLHTGWITTRTANTTVYLNAYQDSGSALSVTGYIRAVKIR